MTIPFSRTIGQQSGVVLFPLIGNNGGTTPNSADTVFAITAHFTRGRIDKAFQLDPSRIQQQLGAPVSPVVDALNEAYIHIAEAFQPGPATGAQGAVVARLSNSDAALSWAICTAAPAAENVWNTASSVSGSYLLAIKDLNCFNDGVKFGIYATTADGSPLPVNTAATYVVVTMYDVVDNTVLYRFAGSLVPSSKDDNGNSNYLPNVAAQLSDSLVVQVATNATVPATCAFWGDSTDEVDATLITFTEGSTSYLTADYQAACNLLQLTEYDYGYIEAGGTSSVALLTALFNLGYNTNKQVVFDIPGAYTAAEAISFIQSLNVDSYYAQAYWAPLLTNDPVNGGRLYIGTGGIQVGLRCGRNAVTDGNGIPPKNYPIAGVAYSLPRTGIVQTYTPSPTDMSNLAVAKINPVIFTKYNSGGKYVFFDSLTCQQTTNQKKLIATAEMSSQVDDWVTAAVQEFLQLPMSDTIRKSLDFLKTLFDALAAAKWLVASSQLSGGTWSASVKPNAQSPYDKVDIRYTLSYDGTTRVITVQQTLAKR